MLRLFSETIVKGLLKVKVWIFTTQGIPESAKHEFLM